MCNRTVCGFHSSFTPFGSNVEPCKFDHFILFTRFEPTQCLAGSPKGPSVSSSAGLWQTELRLPSPAPPALNVQLSRGSAPRVVTAVSPHLCAPSGCPSLSMALSTALRRAGERVLYCPRPPLTLQLTNTPRPAQLQWEVISTPK